MDAYRELLRDTQVRSVSLAVLFSGLGGGAVPLALVLLVRPETCAFAGAGAVVGPPAPAIGVFTPIRGRLVDTKGQHKTLTPLAFVHVCCLPIPVALAGAGASTWSP